MVTTREPRSADKPAAPAKKQLTRSQRENRAGLAYLSPTLVVVLVVVVLPILWTVMLAFQDIRLINVRRASFFGDYTLDNLELVLTSPAQQTTTAVGSRGQNQFSSVQKQGKRRRVALCPTQPPQVHHLPKTDPRPTPVAGPRPTDLL